MKGLGNIFVKFFPSENNQIYSIPLFTAPPPLLQTHDLPTCKSLLWFSHRSCRNRSICFIRATLGGSFLSSFSLLCFSATSSWLDWLLVRLSSDSSLCRILRRGPRGSSSSSRLRRPNDRQKCQKLDKTVNVNARFSFHTRHSDNFCCIGLSLEPAGWCKSGEKCNVKLQQTKQNHLTPDYPFLVHQTRKSDPRSVWHSLYVQGMHILYNYFMFTKVFARLGYKKYKRTFDA